MSEIDNLESLSNAELRGKIKEYGLQNIPVTDTSRNVIIKRLRASMGGAATPAKKTGRRETIAVERASPAKLPQAINESTSNRSSANRRTIAVTLTKDDADGNKISSRRRSVNAGPAAVPESEPITQSSVGMPTKERRRSIRDSPTTKMVSQQRRMSTIVLDSDDEDDVVAAAEKFEKQQQRRSNSRAPSLSKTAVVVNAFNQNLETLAEENSSFIEKSQQHTAAEEARRQQIEADAAVRQEQEMRQLQQQLREQELTKQRELLKKQQLQEQLKKQQQFLQKKQQQQQEQQQKEQLLKQQQQQEQQQKEQLLKHQQQQEELLKLKQKHADERIASFTRIYDKPVSSQFIAKPLATSTMSSNIYPRLDTGYLYNREAGGMGIGATGRTVRNVHEFSDDTEAEDQKSDAEQIDSPFLSNFARNLKRLQPEPLRASPGGDLTRRFVRSRTAQEVTGRVALPRAYSYGRGENKSFMSKLANWSEKYHLARHLFLLIVLGLVFFISYKFWQ